MRARNRVAWAVGVGLFLAVSGWGAAQEAARTAMPTSGTSSGTGVAPVDTAETAVPPLIKFTGEARDLAGKPITGVADVTFSIYSQQAGGEPLWFETQTVELNSLGRYTVLLGAARGGVPLSLFSSGEARWLGVEVGNGPEQPRVLLLSVPYALKAADAETLGGRPLSDFLLKNASSGTSATGTGTTTKTFSTATAATSESAATTNTTGSTTVTTAGGTVGYIPMWDSASDLTNSAIFQSGTAIGIGTATPGELLEVDGPAATVRVKNTGDGLGGFLGQNWDAWQLGVYNPGSSPYGVLAAGEKRSYFGFDLYTGKIGSLSNDFGVPTFRNVLDDGSGNASFAGTVTATTFSGNGSGLTNVGSSTSGAVIYGSTGTFSATTSSGTGVITATQAGAGAAASLTNSNTGDLLDAFNAGSSTVPVFKVDNSGGAYFAGQVGIGAASPAYPLTVQGSGNEVYSVFSEDGTDSVDNLKVQIAPGGGTSSTRIGYLFGKFGNGFWLANPGTGPLIFGAGAGPTERMRITPAGNVGIGTSAPAYTLDVSGTANATTFRGSGASLTSIPNSALTNSSINLSCTGMTCDSSVSLGGTLHISSSGSGVTSFNGRTGAVVPQSGDYSFSQLSGAVGSSQLNGAYGNPLVLSNSANAINGIFNGTYSGSWSGGFSVSVSSNYAVYGSSGSGIGVYGNSSTGNGVYGQAASSPPAVLGINTSTGKGVEGLSGTSSPSRSDQAGVYGESNWVGVMGVTSGGAEAVAGISLGAATGVRGESSSGNGVYAYSSSGTGVAAYSGNTAVYGSSLSSSGTGVYGYASGSSFAYGVWGQSPSPGYAGYFSGNVDVTGTLYASAKYFRIDDPLDPANKYLYHVSVESSEMMNIYSGNVRLDASGGGVVELPEWFAAENRDFRYQLTAIGAPAPGLYIAEEIANHHFKIAGGRPGMKVSWLVTAVRQDAYAKAHPVRVEVDKPDKERGYYIHPELYGAPPTKSIEWARHPELMKRLQEQRARASGSAAIQPR